jgi:hypothetical protein
MAQLPAQVRSAFRFFAFYLGNGTLAQDVLGDCDYLPVLSEGYGSTLELTMSIFVNSLDVDETGTVRNEAAAMRRAAQYLRSYCDSSYTPEPPFEAWETELV